MSDNKKAHEPLIHIVKRTALPQYRQWLIRVGAVVLALVVTGIITMMLTGENPISVYSTMIDGAFGSSRRVWKLLQSSYPTR